MISILFFASPEPVTSLTMDTIAFMLQRVVLLEERVGLWMAIFILNTVVTLFASLAGALLILPLPLEVTDIRYRQVHPLYARFAKQLDRVGYILLWKPLVKLFQRFDKSFAVQKASESRHSSSHNFWSMLGYSGTEFHNMFYILPYLIPALTVIVNGIVMGMVLTVTIVKGAYEGILLAGYPGFFLGITQQSLHFFAFTMPHGILELSAVFSAIAIGHTFALQHSHELATQRVIVDPPLEVFDKNVKHLVTFTKEFLTSKGMLSTLFLITCLLFLAAYIEVYITPDIAKRVLMIFD
jgi:uncharacterized membrane protein SpoIIM required for sporulation